MLHFIKKIPQKLFGKHKKTKDPVVSLTPVLEETQTPVLETSEEPPRPRRTKKIAYMSRSRIPPPSPIVEAELEGREEIYSKIQKQTAAFEGENSSKMTPKESMNDEIVRKAKEHRHRTHIHNHHYKGKGKDIYHLEGRELKSVFEDDDGKKLSPEERQKILRELQKGERKRHFR